MKTCKGCGLETVDPTEMARYDVLNPEFDLSVATPEDMGPYDEACFAETYTGKQIATASGQPFVD